MISHPWLDRALVVWALIRCQCVDTGTSSSNLESLDSSVFLLQHALQLQQDTQRLLGTHQEKEGQRQKENERRAARKKARHLTEDILALFPESHMPKRVKDALRQQDLILDLTHWMRNLSETYWGGFGNTSDLDFWQAHQWDGSKSHSWRASNLTAPAQWVGQPNRLNGSPLAMPHQKNVWFVATRYNVLLDGGFFTGQLQDGMTFNHMTNTEWFRYTGVVMHYGHELSPVQIKGRPYAEFKPAQQPRAFTPYSVSLSEESWCGFLLRGPGYLVDFTGYVNQSAPLNADGSPNIYHAAVYGEVMADPDSNTELETDFQLLEARQRGSDAANIQRF